LFLIYIYMVVVGSLVSTTSTDHVALAS
jgi:hypothetical protein